MEPWKDIRCTTSLPPFFDRWLQRWMLVEIGRSKISHSKLGHNDSTTLVNLCFHHKFTLDRRCQFSSQILVTCGKFWFSAFIWRKRWLRLIECSRVLTVRLLLVKERVLSSFNASRAVVLMLRTGMAVEKKTFSKIPNWRHYLLKTRSKRKKNLQNHWEWLNKPFRNASKPWEWFRSKQIGYWVRVKAERCWTAFFFCLWTAASKTQSEAVFTSHCDRWQKMCPLQ